MWHQGLLTEGEKLALIILCREHGQLEMPQLSSHSCYISFEVHLKSAAWGTSIVGA